MTESEKVKLNLLVCLEFDINIHDLDKNGILNLIWHEKEFIIAEIENRGECVLKKYKTNPPHQSP